MKDKIVMVHKEVEQFQGEVIYKEKVLLKMRKGHEANLKECIQIKDETSKCIIEIKGKKVCLSHKQFYLIL